MARDIPQLLTDGSVYDGTAAMPLFHQEKAHELHRFAEVGKLSMALFHELANHLTILNLAIENLEAQGRQNALKRMKQSISHIEALIDQTRDRLSGKIRTALFDVASEVEAVSETLHHKAGRAGVPLKLKIASSRTLRCHGDTMRFRQMMTNIISNAIDAYDSTAHGVRREVCVTLSQRAKRITIKVEDWGRGIRAEDHRRLFEPFYSTKKSGMGLGLYIARQIAAEEFGGSVIIDNSVRHTAFVINLNGA